MRIEDRNEHLDIRLGIKEPVVEEVEQEIIPAGEPTSKEMTELNEHDVDHERKSQLIAGRKRLHDMFETAELVFQSHADVATDFSKSRDVEAFSALGKTMIELNKEIRATNEEIYDKPEEKKDDTKNITQNNVVFNGDTRELLDMINGKKQDNKDK
jgi:hypothetical protein